MATGGIILKKNKFKIDKSYITSSEIEGFVQQKGSPRFILSSQWNKTIFERTSSGKSTRFKRWVNNSLVKKPVYLDTNLSNQSCKQIKLYLDNIGHFHGKVFKTVNRGRHSVKVNYYIEGGNPYVIRNINWVIPDSSIQKLILAVNEKSLLSKGDIFNAYTLDNERTRITQLLKRNGYYAFSKEYLNFQIDSNFNSDEIELKIICSNPKNVTSAGTIEDRHYQYDISSIDIFPDYDPYRVHDSIRDTIVFVNKTADSTEQHFQFLSSSPMRLRYSTIANSIFLRTGNLFDIKDVDQSYDRLDELQYFKYINFIFKERPADSGSIASKHKSLDCVMQLSPNQVQSYSVVAEGTNSGGDFGLASNLIYQNRNLFRGAELFTFTLKGAMEVQKRLGPIVPDQENKFFNTFEAGAYARLIIPKFLLPVDPERFNKYFRPKSTLNAGFNFQQRTSYKRYLMEGSFGYEWRESKTKKHIFNPVEISSISIFPDSTFMDYLATVNDDRLSDQYTDHLIMSLKYSYVFNNQKINKKEDFWYFRTDVEVAGNLINLMNQFLDGKKDDNGNFELFGLRYSQFLKAQVDFRMYNMLGKGTMVFRTALGFGVPYGNSDALPFDKGFYAGGANGMRGWPIRSLGPGSVSSSASSLNSERMGDIMLESNLEYRFSIASIVNGAIFVDAGNVWLLSKNDQYPGGEFRNDLFFREIALDAGIGLRFDFTFFVFRFDGAIPIRDPALPEVNRWIQPRQLNLTDIMWNLGIGYPF